MFATECANGDVSPRIARRVDVRCELVTMRSDRPVAAHCMALSVRGAWLEANTVVSPNEEVIVCFAPPRRSEPLMLLGHVTCTCGDPRLLSRRCPPGGISVAVKFEALDVCEELMLGECLRGFPPPRPQQRMGPTYVPSIPWRNSLLPSLLPTTSRDRQSALPPAHAKRPLPAVEKPLPLLQPLLEPEPRGEQALARTERPRLPPPRRRAPAMLIELPAAVPQTPSAPPRARGRRTSMVVATLVVLFATAAFGAAPLRFRADHATAAIAKSALTHETPTPQHQEHARPAAVAQRAAVAAGSFDRETIEGRAVALAEDALRACVAGRSPAELGLVVRLAPTGYPVGVAITDTAFAYTREGQCIARRMMAVRAAPFAGPPINLSVRVRR